MKKNKISGKTLALVAAALLLIAGGGFTGTRAALSIWGPEHFLEFETDTQDVVIQEAGVATDTLLTSLEGKMAPGRVFDEVISARNATSGDKEADQFVRIVVRKYWADSEGNKVADEELCDPALISLTLDNTDLWQRNPDESTDEREVYYYRNIVAPGESTAALTSSIKVDSKVADAVQKSEPDGIITYTYDYDGYKVCLEAEAQSIQTHNADGAVKSIWGVQNVTATDTALTVN